MLFIYDCSRPVPEPAFTGCDSSLRGERAASLADVIDKLDRIEKRLESLELVSA